MRDKILILILSIVIGIVACTVACTSHTQTKVQTPTKDEYCTITKVAKGDITTDVIVYKITCKDNKEYRCFKTYSAVSCLGVQ